MPFASATAGLESMMNHYTVLDKDAEANNQCIVDQRGVNSRKRKRKRRTREERRQEAERARQRKEQRLFTFHNLKVGPKGNLILGRE